jgi:hypothetical protein
MDLLLQVGKDELVVKSVFDDFLKTSQPFGLIGQIDSPLVRVKKKCALSLKMLNEDMIFIQI